jgi:hypothetical protein
MAMWRSLRVSPGVIQFHWKKSHDEKLFIVDRAATGWPVVRLSDSAVISRFTVIIPPTVIIRFAVAVGFTVAVRFSITFRFPVALGVPIAFRVPVAFRFAIPGR